MTWMIATYEPISLFSLRPYHATTSGGKTLLAPTAFTIKMALLSASISLDGLETGQRRFAQIRDLRVALALPEQIVLLKSFAKIRRLFESKDSQKKEETVEDFKARQQQKIGDLLERGQYPFQSTIAYREFVQFGGSLRLALTSPQGEPPAWLGDTLPVVNYLGKRGSFVQMAAQPEIRQELTTQFVEITRDSTSFPFDGTLQHLDDCGDTMTFEHADIYNPKRITLGKERVIRHVVLPYRLAQSSRGYSRYERISA
ncbi:MAG TPA: hypothetical protein VH590_12680 [Ktedonobacterales bacterium]